MVREYIGESTIGETIKLNHISISICKTLQKLMNKNLVLRRSEQRFPSWLQPSSIMTPCQSFPSENPCKGSILVGDIYVSAHLCIMYVYIGMYISCARSSICFDATIRGQTSHFLDFHSAQCHCFKTVACDTKLGFNVLQIVNFSNHLRQKLFKELKVLKRVLKCCRQ